jgi:sugar/nucleoside kinase (ribokinase family)
MFFHVFYMEKNIGRFAVATAALVCTSTGPLEKQPARGEVEAFPAGT